MKRVYLAVGGRKMFAFYFITVLFGLPAGVGIFLAGGNERFAELDTGALITLVGAMSGLAGVLVAGMAFTDVKRAESGDADPYYADEDDI